MSKQPVGPNDPLSGYEQGGLAAQAYDLCGGDTRIRYDSSRDSGGVCRSRWTSYTAPPTAS